MTADARLTSLRHLMGDWIEVAKIYLQDHPVQLAAFIRYIDNKPEACELWSKIRIHTDEELIQLLRFYKFIAPAKNARVRNRRWAKMESQRCERFDREKKDWQAKRLVGVLDEYSSF